MRSIIRTVTVAKPLSQVYDQWSRFEDLPRLMPGVVSVRQLDERTTAWVVVIAKERREFAAITTEQRPDDRIAWKGLGTPVHEGVVVFHRLGPSTTRITVQLEWEPIGSFDKVGDRLGIVARHIDKALAGFADHVEAQEVPVEGWRGTIVPSDDDLPADVTSAARGGGGTPARGGGGPGDSKADARGRSATSPTDVPAPGWKDTLKRSVKQVKDDNVQILAAAVAFYLFLSLIPALAATTAIYGLVANPDEVASQLEGFTSGLPDAAAELIVEQARESARADAAALSVGLVVSVALALFSASKGTQALVKALNIAYNEEETRGFLKLRLLSLALTIGIILLAVGGVFAIVAIGNIASDMGAGGLVSALRWPALGALLVLVFALMYRYSPDRDNPKWRWTTPGAVVAAVLIAIGSLAFAYYTDNFGSEQTSGFLGAVGVLLLWLFLSAFAVLFGAEIDSELEHQTARDTTQGDDKPMGQRDAKMADTVAR